MRLARCFTRVVVDQWMVGAVCGGGDAWHDGGDTSGGHADRGERLRSAMMTRITALNNNSKHGARQHG